MTLMAGALGAAPGAEAEAARGRFAPILLGSAVGAIVAARIETAAGCALLALAAAIVSGAPRPSARWVWVGLSGAAIAVLMNAYLTRGIAFEPLAGLAVFGRVPTEPGLRNAAIVVSRLFAAGVAILGLRAAWPGERAADALASMARPLERLRLPVRETRAVLSLALRFAPLLASEWERTARLQAMRAGRPPRGLAERMQRRRATLVPTLVGAFERAERTALALEARHYRVRPLEPARAPGIETIAGWLVVGVALLWR